MWNQHIFVTIFLAHLHLVLLFRKKAISLSTDSFILSFQWTSSRRFFILHYVFQGNIYFNYPKMKCLSGKFVCRLNKTYFSWVNEWLYSVVLMSTYGSYYKTAKYMWAVNRETKIPWNRTDEAAANISRSWVNASLYEEIRFSVLVSWKFRNRVQLVRVESNL